MRTGKRKKISFSSYMYILKKKGLWSVEVETKLYRQIRSSQILKFGYRETKDGLERMIFLHEPNTF